MKNEWVGKNLEAFINEKIKGHNCTSGSIRVHLLANSIIKRFTPLGPTEFDEDKVYELLIKIEQENRVKRNSYTFTVRQMVKQLISKFKKPTAAHPVKEIEWPLEHTGNYMHNQHLHDRYVGENAMLAKCKAAEKERKG